MDFHVSSSPIGVVALFEFCAGKVVSQFEFSTKVDKRL